MFLLKLTQSDGLGRNTAKVQEKFFLRLSYLLTQSLFFLNLTISTTVTTTIIIATTIAYVENIAVAIVIVL